MLHVTDGIRTASCESDREGGGKTGTDFETHDTAAAKCRARHVAHACGPRLQGHDMGISWHAAKFSRRTHGEIMSQVRSHVLFGPHGLTSTHGVENFDNWPTMPT